MASYMLAVLLFQQFIAVFGSFSVTVPQQPILAPVGSSVTLPCSISPSGSALDFEVRWYRPDNFTKPVLLYRDKQVQSNDQDSQYSGRVSLVLESLQMGVMSLHLMNVTVEDMSTYQCYVSSNVHYDSGTISLIVSELGAPPVMSVSPVNGNDWNVSCASDGWHPKPDLQWSDSRASTLQHNHLLVKKDSHGMVSVQSWILVSPPFSGFLSCTISLQGGDSREGRIALRDTMLQSVAGHWKPAFIVTILVFLLSIIAAVLWFVKYRKRESATSKTREESATSKTREEKTEPDGMDSPKGNVHVFVVVLIYCEEIRNHEGPLNIVAAPLHCEEPPDASSCVHRDCHQEKLWENGFEEGMRMMMALVIDDVLLLNFTMMCLSWVVDVILDEATAHGVLKILKEKTVRDDIGKLNVGDSAIDSDLKFSHHTCVLGKKSINSGKSYWEVELGGGKVAPKESWGVGLASATAKRHSDRPLISSDGFWVLSLREGRLHVSTDPAVELPVRQRPQILGVFLDYDKGHLSFINVTEKKYILTISTKFNGAVYPLFDPATGDTAPMRILSKISNSNYSVKHENAQSTLEI
ncbi:butyrophilin subfamily 2 member A1-like [Paramormyrops kingsleyae]|uniref:butyrophilin subfamily 2 member A1-like n=1 Tax=Paramormyrops kingsleyae TaxID=1676925 RepID=UPI003B96A7DC